MKKFWKVLTAFLLTGLCAIPAMAATGEELLKSADVYITFEGEIKDVNGNYSVISEGDTPLVEGKFGQGANCQAAVNYMTVEELTFGTGSFTVATWIKQNAVGGDPVLFGNKDWMSGANPGWLLSARTNDWKYNANVPGGSRTDCEYPYSAVPGMEGIDTWNHIAISVNRETQTYEFYVNGQKYGITTDFSGNGHTEITYDDEEMLYPFNIGEDGTGIINLAQVFDVDYDEFAVFKKALTADEILAIYQYAPEGYAAAEVVENPLTAPLTTTADAAAVKASADLYLSFDNGIKDDMGKYNVVSNGTTATVAGKSGTAANIVSGTNYLTVEGYTFGTDSFTVSTWMNIHDPSSDPVILSNKDWDSGANEGIAFSLRGEGQWRFNANVAGGTRVDDHLTMSEVAVITEQFTENWVYVTYVVDREASTITSFFNGRQIGEPTSFAENGHTGGVYEDTVNNYPLNIGDDGLTGTAARYGYTMNVDLDELAIFKKALTADEVAALYLSYEAPAEAAPETTAPETEAPETAAPETTAPETTAPETEAPETTAPETEAAEVVDTTPAESETAVLPEAPETAPQTFDAGVIAAAAAIVSAAGFAISRKRR